MTVVEAEGVVWRPFFLEAAPEFLVEGIRKILWWGKNKVVRG